MIRYFFYLLFIPIVTLGCTTVPSKQPNKEVTPTENRQDVKTAVGTVVNAVSGKKVSAKYCPRCGKHYSVNLESCPVDGTKLQKIEE